MTSGCSALEAHLLCSRRCCAWVNDGCISYILSGSPLLVLFNVANNYAQFAEYFGHPPDIRDLITFILVKWQKDYQDVGPYWLEVDIVYFFGSYIAGWLYGTWSMLVPGSAKAGPVVSAPSVASAPSVTKIRKPFKIMLWVVVAVILLTVLFGGYR